VVTGYSSCWASHYLRRWVQFKSSVLHCTKRTTSFASKNTHPLPPLSFQFLFQLVPREVLFGLSTRSDRHRLRDTIWVAQTLRATLRGSAPSAVRTPVPTI
jgi:hypothetical protein